MTSCPGNSGLLMFALNSFCLHYKNQVNIYSVFSLIYRVKCKHPLSLLLSGAEASAAQRLVRGRLFKSNTVSAFCSLPALSHGTRHAPRSEARSFLLLVLHNNVLTLR